MKNFRLTTWIDVGIGVFTYYFAFVLKFATFSLGKEFNVFIQSLPLVIVIKLVIFNFFEVHKGIAKYASIEDLLTIIKASVFSTGGIICAITFATFIKGYPRSVPIIDLCLTILLIGGVKMIPRLYLETQRSSSSYKKRILIMGAGDAGIMILREIKNNPGLGYQIIGFIDDDKSKQNRTIQGYDVIGTRHDIQRLVKRYKVEEMIIAIPSAPGSEIRDIVIECKKAKIKFRTIPGLSEIISDTVSVNQIKDVDVEDLLRRLPVRLDASVISYHISGKRILVTGAAGSIGSELCRQIAKFNPAELGLVDIAETPLFNIERSLRKNFPEVVITPFLVDIKDSHQIERLMTYSPNIIYHAAAYKHVPMLEKNWSAAIRNNILGTKNIADMSKKFGIEEFVMVSTDKAVNPESIMGLSKRINEIYIQTLSKNSVTKFVSVRFGNVLGSQGSCIPIFKNQLQSGEPITITHPEVKRYFMTIPEAAQLILQAGTMGKGGEIFILKMGEPIKIVDLVNDLITLSGLNKEEVKISFTGLRPGEKLEEELIGKGESAELTADEKILVVGSKYGFSNEQLNKEIVILSQHLISNDMKAAICQCRHIINSYLPEAHGIKEHSV